MTKKQFYALARIHNWTIVAAFFGTLIVMIPNLTFIPYREQLTVFFPLLFLVMGATSIILAGIAGVVYNDTTTLHSIYSPGKVYRLRGASAVRTGIVYICLGLFLILGLVYIYWNAARMKQRFKEEDAVMLKNVMEQRENGRYRIPDYSP